MLSAITWVLVAAIVLVPAASIVGLFRWARRLNKTPRAAPHSGVRGVRTRRRRGPGDRGEYGLGLASAALRLTGERIALGFSDGHEEIEPR
jgi:hypothetical protein